MKHYYPDKACLTTLRIIIIFSVIILLGLVRYFIPAKFLVLSITIAVAVIAFFVMFVYLPLYFSSIKYTATETEIMKSSGVFIKTHQSVRYSSVQYTSVISSPFSQYTGLNFIVFFVYGGQLRLLFLKQSDAQEILRFSCSTVGEEK